MVAINRIVFMGTPEFAVPSLQTLLAKGVTVLVPPTDHPDWGIRTVHFRDPDGNLIEVNQNLGS